MKNAFKFVFLALTISLSMVACKGSSSNSTEADSSTIDTTIKVDSNTIDSPAKADTPMVDTAAKM
jgi:ABC-type oligopeptide transport system substrate-binding subunit